MNAPGCLLRTIADEPRREEIGGKGLGLFRLRALGLEVPPFMVLTADAYRMAAGERLPDALPANVEAALDVAWSELHAGRYSLAARSSAIEEDAGERSWAGQMESFLNLNSRAALSTAVLGCWRSLQSARAAAYRAAGSQTERDVAMAVVIQRLVPAKAAGVLFTVNPVSGRAEEVLISSVWGLGEGLVGGELDADTFVVSAAGRVVERRLALKKQAVRWSPGGGTVTEAVDDDRREAPSLDDETLLMLAADGRRAAQAAGQPLDIEFAVAEGEIHYLQARPVTRFEPRWRPADGNRQVWDNANIVESYPGITLPLTFSFIRRMYHAVYWQFCQVLGLGEAEIRTHDDMLGRMLGLIQGRVYYNLLNWYRLVALLPGFSYNKGFMEAMMGLKNPEAVTTDAGEERRFVALLKLLRSGLRAVWLQLTLERRIARFLADFATSHAHFARQPYETMAPADILAQYRAMEQAVLWRWKAPIVNDFSAMIFYGVLKRLTIAWNVDPDGGLQNALLSHQGQIESTEVAERLWAVAERLRQQPALCAQVLAATPERAIGLLEGEPAIWRELQAYLDTYGDRCIAELKLESHSMKDDPAFCIAMLQNYLRQSAERPETAGAERPDPSLEAESLLAERLHGPKLWAYRWVLKRARRAIRNRENQRLARTRAFAVVRRMMRGIGSYLAAHGLLAQPDDVFYLELEELDDVVGGTTATPDLRALVKLRQDIYDSYRRQPPLPDHVVTFGLAGLPTLEAAPPLASPGAVLTGLGACPGIIERPAIVLLEPDTSVRLNGEILVTRQTDPGWVLLFHGIGGLVVERGSMLSHSAIVAREMGLPAVVGVADAVSRIRTGDLLRLDGRRGTVQVIRQTGEGGR